MNLLQETIQSIKRSGHEIKDIMFIGSEHSGHSCTWKEFETLADQDYDDGYGAAKVAIDLIIVFKDGAKMWRGEYDGSEWWNFSTPFKMPEETHPIKNLFTNSVGWDELNRINEKKEKYHD